MGTNSSELKELIYSQEGATFYGAEAKATVDLVRVSTGTLRLLGLADYVRAKLEDGGNVPRIAPYHLGAGLNWDAPAFGAGFVFRYTGRQDETGFAETETAGFTSLDADASWRPFKDAANVQLVLVGRNLTDTTQRNAVALNKDDVIMPGREVRFLIRASL